MDYSSLASAGLIGAMVSLAIALTKVIEKLVSKKETDTRRRADDESMDKVERNLERMAAIQVRTVESLDRVARFAEDHKDRIHDLHNDVRDISRGVDALRSGSGNGLSNH